METLQDLYKKHQFDKTIALKSRNWFRQRSKELSGVTSNQFLKEGGIQSKGLIPGNMYAFYYSPKHRDTLPYYDTFPLIIPYAADEKGFIGLNLHYLPPYFRVRLLDRLLKFANSTTLNEKTKILYSWQLIKSAATEKWAAQCIHRYLNGYVKSRFVKVTPTEWFQAAMLPTASFKKQSQQHVWSQYA